MRTLLSNLLDRFITFLWVDLFLVKIIAIYCIAIKFITFRIDYVDWLAFIVRIWILFVEIRAVRGVAIKRLIVRIVLSIFYHYFIFQRFFRAKFIKVLRSRIERNAFIFIFYSRDYLFSHLWFVTRKVLSIRWINIVVWLILLGF